MYLVAVDGLEPPTSQMTNDLRHQCQLVLGIFLCLYIIHALCQLSYTAYHEYSKHHRSRLNCFAHVGHPFLSSFAFCFSFRLLLCHSNHSAFNSHNFPRTMVLMVHATTCQPYCSYRDQPVVTAGSEITSFLPVVLTGWLPSLSTPSALRSLSLPFQLRALHDPFRDYSPPILPLCIQYIQPTCRDCSLHVPRRL